MARIVLPCFDRLWSVATTVCAIKESKPDVGSSTNNNGGSVKI